MNALASSLTPGWELAGWTMVHFLWAGTAVAALGAAVRLTLAWAAPTWRYAASLAALAAVAATPVCIAVLLAPHYAAPAPREVAQWDRTALPPTALAQTAPLPPQYIELKPSAAVATAPSALAATPAPATSAMVAPATSDLVAPATADWVASQASPSPAPGMPVTTPAEALWGAVPRGVQAWARVAARWLPIVWLVGAPLTFLWTCVGLAGGERLRREAQPAPDHWAAECRRIAQALGVAGRVGVALSTRIAQPVLVGVVRPLVLLPASAASGLSASELEMILWHELAHVRRWDNLVNLIQRTVEAALFFHPCVWWLSNQVRRDREACCDRVVVRHTQSPRAYAELLLNFAGGSPWPAAASLAQHPLGGRIREILRIGREPLRVSRAAVGAAALAVLAGPALWQLGVVSAVAQSPAPPTRGAQAPAGNQAATSRQTREDAASSTDAASQRAAAADDPFGGDPFGSASPFGSSNDSADNGLPLLSPGDQATADLAYRMLGVELEPGLTAEGLDPVRALKFRGGLRVVAVAFPPGMGGMGMGGMAGYGGGPGAAVAGPAIASNPLQVGDILVGLHAWPVESLGQLAQILDNPQLAELSPVKYYAVRMEHGAPMAAGAGMGMMMEGGGYGGAGGYGGEGMSLPQPTLIRGRLHLDPTVVRSLQGGAMMTQAPDLWSASPAAGTTTYVPGPAVPPQPAIPPTIQSTTPVTPPSAPQPQLAPPAPPLPSTPIPTAPGPPDNNPFSDSPAPALPYPSPNSPPALPQTGPYVSIHVYEGKTFDQWRDQWHYELSLERRLEAIKAMTAFGAVGHAAGAAEAIVKIAAQYDWKCIGCNPALEPLQNACLAAFSPRYQGPMSGPLPAEACRQALASALRSGNPNAQLFATYAVREHLEGPVVDAWVDLASAAPPDIQGYVYAPLRNMLYQDLAPPIQAWVDASFASDNPARISVALSTRQKRLADGTYQLDPPEPWRALLKHQSPAIRLVASRYLQGADLEQAIPWLREAIADAEQQTDPGRRLAAVRAAASLLAALREGRSNGDERLALLAEPAVELATIVAAGPVEFAAAAVACVPELEESCFAQWAEASGADSQEAYLATPEGQQAQQKYREALAREEAALQAARDAAPSGYGSGAGMGGMGGMGGGAGGAMGGGGMF